jgi:hypothetical protein
VNYKTSSQAWQDEGNRETEQSTDDRNNMKAKDHNDGITSPDGKWWASQKTLEIKVNPGERLVNAQVSPAWGDGAAWTSHSDPSYNQDTTDVSIVFKGWSKPASIKLSAQVQHLATSQQDQQLKFKTHARDFSFILPADAADPNVVLSIGGAFVKFAPGDGDRDGYVAYDHQSPNGGGTEYFYKLLK